MQETVKRTEEEKALRLLAAMEKAEEDDLATMATFFETGEDTGDPKWTGLCIRDIFRISEKVIPYLSCPSWQWHRAGSCWSPVRTLQVAPLWCDLRFFQNSCGNKAAENLCPVQVAEHFSFLLLLSSLHFSICPLLCPVLRPRGHSQSSCCTPSLSQPSQPCSYGVQVQ